MHNAGYIPPASINRKKVKKPIDFSNSLDDLDRDEKFSFPPRRRVQIVENRPTTPSTDHFSDSDLSNVQNPTVQRNKTQIKSGSTDNSKQKNQQDQRTYVDAFHNQRRRSQQRVDGKVIVDQYKTFRNNGGLGPSFLPYDAQTYEEKVSNYFSFIVSVLYDEDP